MNKSPTRNVLIAFIASPNDLSEERRALHEVVRELNSIFRPIDWQIDLLGWEDTMPGVARPQELINRDVDACQLFIGVLWKRWGTPTGSYSSGFEEEFERAISRKMATNEPEVWLSFKHVESDPTDDPGPQFQQVLEFRQREIEHRRVLFKDFDDLEDWKSKLRQWLSRFILERHKESQQFPERTAVQELSRELVQQDETPSQVVERDETQSSSDQLIELTVAIDRAIRTHSADEPFAGVAGLDSFQVARSYLFSSTLMLSLTNATLGVHEIHLLYLNRERLHATPQERTMIFRTLVADESNLIAAWYWLAWMTFDDLGMALLSRVSRDRDFTVRLRGWEMLRLLSTPLPSEPEWRDYLLKIMVSEDAPAVRRAAVEYLAAVATERDLSLLESFMVDDRDGLVRREASNGRLVALARLNPQAALEEKLPDVYVDKKRIISNLQDSAGRISTASLAAATKSEDDTVRLFALTELARRNELTVELSESLLTDISAKVSDFVYRHLIQRGQRIDPSDVLRNVSDESDHLQFDRASFLRDPPLANPREIVLDLFRNYSEGELLKLTDWRVPIGFLAYEALALYHFSSVAERVRADLKDDFKSDEEESFRIALAEWKEVYSNPANAFLTNYRPGMSLLRGLWGFKEKEEENTPESSARREVEAAKKKYVAGALAGISKNGKGDDVEFGRKYLSNEDYRVRLEALRVVVRFGAEQDVQSLIGIATSSEGVLQEEAALAALKRTSEIWETARTLIFSTKEVLVRIATTYLLNESNLARTALFLEPMLLEKNDVIRKKTLAFFVRQYAREDLEQLLIRYTGNVTYYYDVVCWLDRVLYAPAELRRVFFEQIESELD